MGLSEVEITWIDVRKPENVKGSRRAQDRRNVAVAIVRG